MPSAEETTFLIEVMPADAGISQDSFTSRDVDVLVSRIKENLRLSGFKSRSSLAQKMRASPYRLPSRSWAEPSAGGASNCELCASRAAGSLESDAQQQLQPRKSHHHHHHHYRRYHRGKQPSALEQLDDSYERFQALLRNGALIKEAVKRLQTSPEDDELLDEDEDSSSGGGVGGPKRRATSTSATSTTLDSMDEEEDEDDFLFRRKRFYYDSEDEPLPPVYQPLDL